MEAEKELGVSGRAAILEYGIERFNAHCRSSVMRYTEQWEQTIRRAGRWVDFRNDYKTMDASYMESVLWAFKRLWDLGLIYEGLRVLPYSWAAQTPVSNFETRMDNSTRPRQDPAITVRFRLRRRTDSSDLDPERPSSGRGLRRRGRSRRISRSRSGPLSTTCVLRPGKRRVMLGAECAANLRKELAARGRVATLKGADLVGVAYAPLFPYFAGADLNAFRVRVDDFVDVAEGTGIVHMAPGFGEDDLALCTRAGSPVVVPMDDAGKLHAEIADWAGELVFEADPEDHSRAARARAT